MATVRLVAALAVVAILQGPARAQLPVVPQPHPALDELVKEYRRLGLPIPPPEAELVRIDWFNSVKTPYALGFRYPATKPGESPRCLLGYWLTRVQSERVQRAEPVLGILHRASEWDWFCLAAQCQLRGWNELARALYAEARNEFQKQATVGESPQPVLSRLRRMAWSYWEQQLVERDSDRKAIWLRLRGLADEDRDLLTRKDWSTLDGLKSTLVPRKSKPGSVEALIDDLTDYWDDPDDMDNEIGHSAYSKLIELGFDAVPALIEHLEDKRLTRTSGRGFKQLDSRIIRVGELVSGLLDGLADGAVGEEDAWWFYGTFANPDAARKWWTKAQKIGEEQWLLDHAMPPKDSEDVNATTRTNGLILHVLGAKYPHRLPALYQTILFKRRGVESERITNAIVGSKLPHKRKLALLEDGAAHADYAHRFPALQELSALDIATFQRHLLQTLERFPTEIKNSGFTTPEYRIVCLIRRTDDRKCWAALAAASRRASPEFRLEIIDAAGWAYSPNDSAVNRRECIRYLVGFLDDRSGGSRPELSVGDFTLIRLAVVLGINDSQVIQLPHSPREISLLRDRVRELAEHELARPTK